ncbi:MAG: hypothetical protein V3W34_20630 [Phycisphaerae bacterium]
MFFRALIIITTALAGAETLWAGDLILNEYNAVRASRWLDCDGMDCCCDQGACDGGADDGLPCVCNPPCKADVFFGRVQGNGGNWIELVVTRNHLDIRGWKLEWTEDPSDEGILTLTDDPLWSDLGAGTIVTFTELDTAGGGLDTDTSYDPDVGDWWININTLSSDGTPQTQYAATVTNVLGDGPGAFSVGNDNWQVTILDAESNIVFGPAGEGIPLIRAAVNSREVFKLEEDPSPTIDPASSNYRDGTSSSFGHPNIWRGGDMQQDFTCLRCDDGAYCNGVEVCDGNGICQLGIAPCVGPAHCDEDGDRCLECVDVSECGDGNPCTSDACNEGACRFEPIPGCGAPPPLPPDSDDDGVIDSQDACPETPGDEVVNQAGCACSQLDDDEDGLSNCVDECPDTKPGETVGSHGCSCLQLDPDGDDDQDGIFNCFDACENTGLGDAVDSEGCSCLQLDPDSDDDGDGVPNCLDECPNTPASSEADGAGCTINLPGEVPAAVELPDNDSDSGTNDSGNTDSNASSDETEATSPPVSRSQTGLCGLFGLGGLAFLFAGLQALRFLGCGHPRRRIRYDITYVAVDSRQAA